MDKKLTVRYFRRKKEKGEKIISLSLYDAPSAKLAEECGVELILVGDSMGNTILGYESTVPVTIEESLHHSAAVARGAKFAFIVGDMPFMTYQICPEDAMRNAARYIQEAHVDGVKLEGGAEMAPTVERLVRAGVPVLGHIGLLPQNILTSGGYRMVGKTKEEEERLKHDAKALENAGAFAIVLECIPSEVAKSITESVAIPTIGIGSGAFCDGQVQVVNDILGLFSNFAPKHSKRYADLNPQIKKAFEEYSKEVSDGAFPSAEHSS